MAPAPCGTRTVTSAMFGHLREDAAARAEFFALTRNQEAR